MLLNPFETYKVIEAEKHISIIGAGDQVSNAHNLIIADIKTICTYLERYMHERAAGKSPVDAHAFALRGAKTIIT